LGSITFSYPWWYLLGCLLAGLLAAGLLYYREKAFAEKPPFLRAGLALLRGLSVAMLTFLLLSPLLRKTETEIRKPVIALLQDASESVAHAMDEQELSALQRDLTKLVGDLSRDYEVEVLSFGDQVRSGPLETYSDKETDLEQALRYVGEVFDPQRLGAVVLVTDGIHNRGAHPLYSAGVARAPVYAVGLGDPEPRRDLAIKRLFHNKLAYKGDRFTVQLDLSARHADGERSELSVFDITETTPRLISRDPVAIRGDSHFETRELILEARESGVRRFRFTLTPVAGERNEANNSREMFIEVLDARQKILILADVPHPDLSAIRQALASGRNYQVDLRMRGETGPSLQDYDLVVFHQIPSLRQQADAFMQEWQRSRVPAWFILGQQSDTRVFSQAQSLLQLRGDGRNANEVYPQLQPGFQMFTLSEELRRGLLRFPPLTAPFGEYQAGPGARVLLNQRIGSVATDYPLWLLGEEQGVRIGVLAGEGIWRWRIFDYLQNKRHEVADELIGKTIQYLALKEDKRRFRVVPAFQVFRENDVIVLDGELHNNNWELVNDPDVQLLLKNEQGQEYPFSMNRTPTGYSLQAGLFPPGLYRFSARTSLDGQELSINGQFTVQALELERADLQADHNLLLALADETGGSMVGPGEIADLVDQIRGNQQIKPTMHSSVQTRPLIDWRWLFSILLALLGAEWFIRRYSGAY
jgi:hypothetical protein